MSGVTWSWLDKIRKVDPDFDKNRERKNITAYEFSGDRKFAEGEGPYGTNTST